jgi:NitT/TauT family transport system permease protein
VTRRPNGPPSPTPVRPGRRWRPTVARLGLGAVGVLLAVGGWAWLAWAGIVPESALPGPGATARAAVGLLASAEFHAELADTLGTWAAAMVIASLASIPASLLLGTVPTLERASMWLVHVLRSVPATVLIPVAVVLLGLGFAMKLSVVVFAVAWPVLVNGVYGVRSVDPMTVTVARSMGWRRPRILVSVVLPSAAPSVATGLRIASGIAFVVTLSAELLGASRGVGTLLVSYQDANQPASVYAGVVLVGFTGMILNHAFALLEGRLFRWTGPRRAARA